jgi:hypothetical protein
MLPPLTWDSTLGFYFLFFFQFDIIGILLANIIQTIKSSNLRFIFKDKCSKVRFETHNLSCPHSKALITKPSPHVMTKNDITKDINTYFEQINAFFISLFDLIDLVGSLLHV